MRLMIMTTLAMLIACGDKDDDTAEAVEEVESSEELEGSEGETGEGEMSGDECVDGETQVIEDVNYICEDGLWVEQSTEEGSEE